MKIKYALCAFSLIFSAHSFGNKFISDYTIENIDSSVLIGNKYSVDTAFIVKKGKHTDCIDEVKYENFNCLAHPDATHFIQTRKYNVLIDYDKHEKLAKSVSYIVVKDYFLKKNGMLGMIVPDENYILLKSSDGKKVEVKREYFLTYISKDENLKYFEDLMKK